MTCFFYSVTSFSLPFVLFSSLSLSYYSCSSSFSSFSASSATHFLLCLTLLSQIPFILSSFIFILFLFLVLLQLLLLLSFPSLVSSVSCIHSSYPRFSLLPCFLNLRFFSISLFLLRLFLTLICRFFLLLISSPLLFYTFITSFLCCLRRNTNFLPPLSY